MCTHSPCNFSTHRSWGLVILVIGNNAMLHYTLSWHRSCLWYLMLCCDRAGLHLPDCYLLLESTYACMIKASTDISAEFMVWLLVGEEEEDGTRLDTGLASIYIPMQFFIIYITYNSPIIDSEHRQGWTQLQFFIDPQPCLRSFLPRHWWYRSNKPRQNSWLYVTHSLAM